MRDVGIIEDGALVISDGKFVALGKSDQITSEFLASEVFDVKGSVVCPGFVDAHTHIVYAGNRLDEFELKIQGADYLEILRSGGGILSTVSATRKALYEELVESGRKRLERMLSCGTTTCEIKTGYGLDLETELKMLRVIEELDRVHPIDIVPTFLAAHTIAPEYKENPKGYVDLICGEMLPMAWGWYEQSSFRRNNIPIFCDVFTERNSFDILQSKQILDSAKELGFGIKAHVDQFTNLGGTQLGIDLAAVSVDHLDAISDAEIATLARSNTLGIVVPAENFNAGKTQFAPARRMIDAGCAIAISTDYNPGSAPSPSMSMSMAVACRYQKLLPAEALNAATINAAHAIGFGGRAGSIEIGKQADLAIFRTQDFREIAYEFGGNNVDVVFKGGVRVYAQTQ